DLTRVDNWNPVIGGLRVECVGSFGTLGFAGRRNGISGFVIAGHYPNMLYQNVGQSSISRIVGTVQARASTYADAAWVPCSNVQAKIYESSSTQTPVKGYMDPILGRTAMMSGYATNAVTYGAVTQYLPDYLAMHNQYRASYSAQSGDSGAPVY